MARTIAMPDRRLALLLPSAFLASLGIGIVNQGMIFVVKDAYGAAPATVGWFAALWSIMYFLGCVTLRSLAFRIKASTSMILANSLAALALGSHLAFPGLFSAFVIYGVYGFSLALFWPRLMGWLSSGIEGHTLGRASGYFSLSWSAGGIVSPYISGLLTERQVFLPLFAAVAVFVLNALFLHLGRGLAPLPAPRGRGEAKIADRSSSLRFPAWVGVFQIYIFAAVIFNIFPVFAKDELALTESNIGLILLVRASANAFGFWLFGRLHFWHSKPLLLPIGLALALVFDLAFVFIGSPLGLALGLILIGLIQAALYSASVFYGASGAPDRERRMTIHEALLTAGQIIGSIGGGFVYQNLAWPAIFLCIAAMMFAGIILQFVLLQRRVAPR